MSSNPPFTSSGPPTGTPVMPEQSQPVDLATTSKQPLRIPTVPTPTLNPAPRSTGGVAILGGPSGPMRSQQPGPRPLLTVPKATSTAQQVNLAVMNKVTVLTSTPPAKATPLTGANVPRATATTIIRPPTSYPMNKGLGTATPIGNVQSRKLEQLPILLGKKSGENSSSFVYIQAIQCISTLILTDFFFHFRRCGWWSNFNQVDNGNIFPRTKFCSIGTNEFTSKHQTPIRRTTCCKTRRYASKHPRGSLPISKHTNFRCGSSDFGPITGAKQSIFGIRSQCINDKWQHRILQASHHYPTQLPENCICGQRLKSVANADSKHPHDCTTRNSITNRQLGPNISTNQRSHGSRIKSLNIGKNYQCSRKRNLGPTLIYTPRCDDSKGINPRFTIRSPDHFFTLWSGDPGGSDS